MGRCSPHRETPDVSSLRSRFNALRCRSCYLAYRLERSDARRPNEPTAEGQTRTDARARVRSIVIRIRARNTAIRVRVVVATINHTAGGSGYIVDIAIMRRGGTRNGTHRNNVHILSVCHGGDPDTGAHGTLYQAGTAVRHPDTPLAGVTRVIGKVHAVHHVIFMTVDILVTKAADVVHLRHRRTAVVILLTVPRILVDGVFYQAVRHIWVDGGGFLVADRVRHPTARRAARSTVVRVRARAALFLAVTTTVLRVEKIRDARVHKGINLLHTALDTVIVEVRPAHACGSAATGYASTEFGTDNAAAHNGAQMLVVGNPVGFQVLYLVAVR